MSDAPILAGINRIDDVEAAGDFEKKHVPHIECARDGALVRVTVRVGHLVAHPNLPDHFIEWITVHADDAPIARFDLSAVATAPEVTCALAVEPGTRIAAMESCNLHGLWHAEVIAP